MHQTRLDKFQAQENSALQSVEVTHIREDFLCERKTKSSACSAYSAVINLSGLLCYLRFHRAAFSRALESQDLNSGSGSPVSSSVLRLLSSIGQAPLQAR